MARASRASSTPQGGIVLEPRPAQRPRPPIWVASWGSPSGLRLVAHHGDGWIASADNTTPDLFGAGLGRISDELRLGGRTPESIPNAISTAWLYITEDTKRAESVLTDILAPMLNDRSRRCAPSRCRSVPPSSAPNGSASSRVQEPSASSSGRSLTSWSNSSCFAIGSPPASLTDDGFAPCRQRSELNVRIRQRSELNAARISVAKSSGSSQAAKWPPLSTSLK